MMQKIKDIFIKFGQKVTIKRIIIAKTMAVVAVLIFVSFLFEYLGFGRHFNYYRFLLILSILGLAYFFVVFRKKIGERPEIGFLAVALICGSLLSFSEPKEYVSWDEQIHYKSAERLAANVVPNMFFRQNSVDSSYSYEQQNKLNAAVDGQYKKPKVKSSTDSLSYNKLAYIPSAIVIAVGNLFHLPFHIIFIFARWVNLLVYVLIVFFAIKKLKSGKMIMSVVALFPTAIFLASNYGYDCWVTAFSMLGLAYLFSELQQPEKKITTKEIVIMIGAFVIGLGPKAIYFPLLFLLFLLKKEKFASSRQYKKYLLVSTLTILFVVGSFALPFLISGKGGGDTRGGSDVNSSQQVKFILSDPVSYSKILYNFIKNYIDPRNAGGFISFFAYLGMTKYFWLTLGILGVVTFTDKNKYDKQTSGLKIKFLVIAIYLLTTVLISTALYVAFTPVRNESIAGVQPRYLIPLVFPLLFVIGSSRIKNLINKNIYNTIIFILMAFVLLQGTWDLIIRNYY